MKRVVGKVALVSGAAAGIGRACALRLAGAGARLVVSDVAGAELVANEIRAGGGGEPLPLRLDVTSEADWVRAIDTTVQTFGGIDVLVNNAGIYLIKELPETTVEEFERVLRINVLGVFLGMKHSAPRMAAQAGGGSIINMSSAAAMIGLAGHSAYGASKGAVRAMTKHVAIEYARRNVRVNSVHPAYIRTQMAEMGARSRHVSVEQLGEAFPTGTIGEPDDVAWGVVYLASDESRFVTGSELVIDGAATAM